MDEGKITELEKAARQALVAMESFQNGTNKLFDGEFDEEITALRQALKPEGEEHMKVAEQAIETIYNLAYLVRQLYPDDQQTIEILNIDEVLEQAQVAVNNLTK